MEQVQATPIITFKADGYKYALVSPEKIQAYKAIDDSDAKKAYIQENYDSKISEPGLAKKVTTIASDGAKYSIRIPEKIVAWSALNSREEKLEYLKANYDEKE